MEEAVQLAMVLYGAFCLSMFILVRAQENALPARKVIGYLFIVGVCSPLVFALLILFSKALTGEVV